MSTGESAAAPSEHRFQIFWASFLTLIAAGVGFGVRTAILKEWGADFGFTKSELGGITGGGLVGFGVIILLASVLTDLLGYRLIMLMAFLLHVLSAIVTVAATPVYEAAGKDATYWCLFVGMFLFAIGNGLCEAVINPLTATLYPKQKTHYLNILHAGWPAGLILGAVLAYLFVGADEAKIVHLRWEIPMLFFLAPVLWYGIITLKEEFPISEARAAGVSFGQMLLEFASPVLLALLVLHAMVGYVELGTDSWITNIMENLISGNALLLFIYTSGLMFILRFFAGPIVEHINPLGLLFVSSILGATGLYMLGSVQTGMLILVAATIYGVGKTFLWPTMLGVVGERYPRGGAITMGAVGGIGMLSAGLLGGPVIGYKQDLAASNYLEKQSTEVYQEFKADQPNSPLFLPPVEGLDGAKVEKLKENVADLPEGEEPTAEQKLVLEAGIVGGQQALRWTAVVPATMAVGYLLLLLYFRLTGGYHQVELDAEGHEHESTREPTGADAMHEGEDSVTGHQA